MATYYWVGGSGTWDNTTTTNWSLTLNGPGGQGVPTAADDVVFDGTSLTSNPTITSTSTATCYNFTHNRGSATYYFIFNSGTITVTGTSFTSNGATATATSNFVLNNTGISNVLSVSGGSIGASSFTISAGTWNVSASVYATSSVTVSGASNVTFQNGSYFNALSVNFSTSGTVTLGNCTFYNMANFTVGSSANFTDNGATLSFHNSSAYSTVTLNAPGRTFNGSITCTNAGFIVSGDTTIKNLTTSTGSTANLNPKALIGLGGNLTITGTLEISGMTGATAGRTVISSTTFGVQRTLSINSITDGLNPASLGNILFQDVNITGAVAPLSGANLGDCGNNSGINFPAGRTIYYVGTSTTFTNFSLTSGGASGIIQTPQDTIIINNSSPASAVVYSFNGNGALWTRWRYGKIDMSARTTAFTLQTLSTAPIFLGDLILSSAVTVSSTDTPGINFYPSSNRTITSNGGLINVQFFISTTNNATVTFSDNINMTGTSSILTFNNGILNLNGRTINTDSFGLGGSASNIRRLDFNGGTINITGSGKTVLSGTSYTNFSYTGTPVINLNYSGGTGTRTAVLGSSTGTETDTNVLPINVTAGTDTVAIYGKYKDLNLTGFSGIASFSPTTPALTLRGNLTVPSTVSSIVNNTNSISFVGNGVMSITSSGKTVNNSIILNSVASTGSLNINDNLILGPTKSFTLTSGTLNLINYSLTSNSFITTGSVTRAINFLDFGKIYLTADATSTIWSGSSTGLSLSGSKQIYLTGNSQPGNTLTFSCGSMPQDMVPNIYVANGYGNLAISTNVGDLYLTGFNGTLNNLTTYVHGNVTYSSTMQTALGTSSTYLTSYAADTKKIKTNGIQVKHPIVFSGTGTYENEDDLTMNVSRSITFTSGTWNANNKNVTCGSFVSSGTITRTLNMGNGTWNMIGRGTFWNMGTTPTNITLNPDNCSIVYSNTDAGIFTGGGLRYNNLVQNSSNTLTIQGSNIFNDIRNNVQPTTIVFTTGTTQTVNNFSLSGTSGNQVTIQASGTSNYTITKQTIGDVNLSYCSISRFNARTTSFGVGYKWYAMKTSGNINLGNNSGLIFNKGGGSFLQFFT